MPKKGTGIIGDVLKGLISTTGLGVVKPKRLKKEGKGVIGDVLKGLIGSTGLGVVKPKRLKKEGKGIMSSLLKAVVPAIIDVTSMQKGKVEGMGRKRKAGHPKGRGGGALFPAGNYGPGD